MGNKWKWRQWRDSTYLRLHLVLVQQHIWDAIADGKLSLRLRAFQTSINNFNLTIKSETVHKKISKNKLPKFDMILENKKINNN